MAKTLSSASIATSQTILAAHVTQSIDALTGTDAYDITISGSLQTTGSVGISGLLSATPGITHQLTASNAVSASFASSATSASYADNVPAGGLPSGLLSSSAQIASDISGAFGATSASLSSRVAANEVVTAKTLVSSSAQIATEISGAFGAASASFSTRVSANESNISTNTTNITTLTSKTGSYAVTGSSVTFTNITASGNISGSATSTLSIGGTSTLAGNNTLGTNGAGSSHTVYGNSTFTDNLQTNGVFTANGNSILGNASSDEIKIFGDSTITGSLTVSGSTGYVETKFLVGGLRRSTSQGTDDVEINVNGDLLVNNKLRLAGNEIRTGGNQPIYFNNGNITSSYNISASGNIITSELQSAGNILGNKLSIGEYGASGGSISDEILISGSGLQRMSIESTDNAAGLRLKSPSTYNTFIDFEEGSDQRFIIGVLSTDDNFYISTGSALVSGSMFKANRATGDIEITHNISASAVSASTYHGDGSNLTGISSDPFPYNGDVVITGSLTVGDNSANDFDVIVDGGSIEIKRQNNNILRDYTSPGFSSGGAVIFGYRALGSQQGQNQTVAIGRDAGFAQLNSDYAVFMGYAAGGSSGTGDADQSTMIGAEAGYNAKAAGNTFLGYRAGYDIASGTNNIIIGHYAASGSGDLSSQLRIGSGSLTAISASLNTGDIIFPSTASAAYFSGDGSNLTNVSAFPFVGDAVITGSLLISGSTQQFRVESDDVILGSNAGALLDAGTDSFNVFIGTNAGAKASTGEDSVIIGKDAVSQGTYTGTAGVYIGLEAGRSAAGANYNVVIGDGALYSLTGGDNNVALGRYASYGVSTNSDQVHIGYNAGRAATVDKSILIGGEAGVQAGGTGNTAMGYKALRGGTGWTAITTILKNTAIGYEASKITTGARNTVMGYQAAVAATSADNNVIIGCSTAATLTTGDSNIIIGDGVDVASSGTTSELRIGSGSVITISGSLATGYLHDVKADNFIISSSGTVLPTIESSDGIAALKLKSGGSHAYIDMDEGADQRWIAGMYTNDNSYRIASGSAFASNTIFELEQNGQARFTAGVEISGSITYPNASISTKTGTSNTLTSDEHLVLIDASGGAVTIDLPDAGTYPGREINFKVTTAPGGNTITLQRQGSDTIDGATSNTALDAQWEALSVISDGSSQWLIF